jgi:predicted nucleotide-binding protein
LSVNLQKDETKQMANRKAGGEGPFAAQISKSYALTRLLDLLARIDQIRGEGYPSRSLPQWENDVKAILAQLYGENSFLFKQFDQIHFFSPIGYSGQPESENIPFFTGGLEQAEGILRSRISELQHELGTTAGNNGREHGREAGPLSKKVFVVHGHDHGAKETVARFLSKLQLEPIILHEQADQGRTIIEKFEAHAADVQCAVVILTADDVASAKATPEKSEPRARQNVILEFGFFVGKLGRERTFALVEKGVALPSDMHGLVYIPLDNDDWRMRLVKELKAAGLEVDANQAF